MPWLVYDFLLSALGSHRLICTRCVVVACLQNKTIEAAITE